MYIAVGNKFVSAYVVAAVLPKTQTAARKSQVDAFSPNGIRDVAPDDGRMINRIISRFVCTGSCEFDFGSEFGRAVEERVRDF